MKVYQINVVCGNGSTGRIVVDLSCAIRSQGGECRVAYGRGNAPSEIDSYRIGTKLGVCLHVLMTRLTDRHGLYSKISTKRLIKDIVDWAPDIIHLHNIHGYYVNYELLFSFLKKYNKPVVWTMHDCWAFTGHCTYFDFVGCGKWKKGCEECVQLREYPSSWKKDASVVNYEKKRAAFTGVNNMRIVSVSNWLKSIIEQSFFYGMNIRTIYNGIDINNFRPIESDLRERYRFEDKKIVLGVANAWSGRKGLKTFSELSELLPSNIQIVLIGITDKQRTQISEKIYCLERTTSIEELAKWYTVADVYVNASVEETMGLTTIEAFACGTPAIVMNATAVPEMMAEGCGEIIMPGDLEALVEAIERVEKTPAVSKRCRERAGEFSKLLKYQEYIDLYTELCGQRKDDYE